LYCIILLIRVINNYGGDDVTGNNSELVNVRIKNGPDIKVKRGTSLLELSGQYASNPEDLVIAATVNNEMKELVYTINEDCTINFITTRDEEGFRIYCRSLFMILVKAIYELFPDKDVKIQHSISKGIYCELTDCDDIDEEGNISCSILTEEQLALIEKRMHEISDANIPFIKKTYTVEEAKQLLTKFGREDRYHTLEYRSKECTDKQFVTLYDCGGYLDYFYGYMAPHTGYIKLFALKKYETGFILLFPQVNEPNKIPEFVEQKQLFSVFKEYKRWGRILGVDYIGKLNDLLAEGKAEELINISEALHEKKIAYIADLIYKSEKKKRVVLISGPSSSGKTTFAERLSVQLRVNGLKPVTINLDDYFVDREFTPRDENGFYNFEALEALDIKLFNRNLRDLLDGKEVEIPIFNFIEGCREEYGRKLKLRDDNILIIEGIHGLNDKLTENIPNDLKFKIYVSALTSMNLDDHNRIPSTDTRLLRRIVRDNKYRGASAIDTIRQWPSVRRGEVNYIFPYQENADIMFNSSHMVELSILRTYAEPLLKKIGRTSPAYAEAKRLLTFLSYIYPLKDVELPKNSIIREFTG